MNQVQKLLQEYSTWISLPDLTVSSVIEIILIVVILYKVLSSIKGSRTWTILKGIAILFIFYLISSICDFYVIKTLFESSVFIVGVGMIIIFSADIKNALERIGKPNQVKQMFSIRNLLHRNKTEKSTQSERTIREIANAARQMSKDKTGALILFERNVSLSEYDNTGIPIDAEITSQLILNIFEHNTPLHDGAMIIRKDRILSATCYLPLSDNHSINKNLGTRHRAAVGVSEVTDCVVLVVSEETGNISICQNGKIEKVSGDTLEEILQSYLKEEEIPEKKKEKENWKHMALSICFGLILWVTIFNYEDPAVTKTFTVPTTIINEQAISSVGQTYQIVEGDTVTFQVKGKNSVVKTLNEDDFKAVADLSKLSYVYAVPIEIVTEDNPNIEIKIIRNDTLKVELDELIDADLNVTVQDIGTPAEGYQVKECIADPVSIQISGPKSKLNTLKEAVAVVDTTGIDQSIIKNVPIQIYDKNGTLVDTSDCTMNIETVNVTVTLAETKTVPLKLSTSGTPANGYELESVTSETTEIEISADGEILDQITEINAVIDLTNISNNTTKMINILEFLPEGVSLVDEDLSVLATIKLKGFEEKTLTIFPEDIVIRNLDDEMTCTVSDEEWKVTLSAPSNILSSITVESLQPYLDATGLEEGEYNLNIQFANTTNVTISEIPSIQIHIQKK